MPVTIDVALYGSVARFGGGKHVAQVQVQLQPNARVQDLLGHLKIPPEEIGYFFINAVLCDVPGMNTSHDEFLNDGDHAGIFSLTYMWPYQYRDGVRMSESLQEALNEHGALHHIYGNKDE